MITSLIHTINRQAKNNPSSLKSFQPGQIFHGKIHKLFPNQTAEVQVGQQKFIAKLEVPLAAGGKYWFQVASGEGKIHLKVLPIEEKGMSGTKSTNGLLQQMNLPNTKLSQEVLSFFIKENLPMTEEHLQRALVLLKGVPQQQEGMAAIKELMLRNLPATKDVFHGLLSAQQKEPLQQILQTLHAELNKGELTKTGTELRSLLANLLSPAAEKTNEKIIGQLVQTWLNPKGGKDAALAYTILQKLSLIGRGEEGQQLQQATAKVLANPQQLSLTEQDRALLSEGLKAANSEEGKMTLKTALVSMFYKEGNRASPRDILPFFQGSGKISLTLQNTSILTSEERQMLQQASEQAEREVVRLDQGREMGKYLREQADRLGLNYESKLLQALKGGQEAPLPNQDVVKSLLLRFLAEEPSAPMREASEALLQRITGIQLQAQESGPQQQLVMQIPLSLMNKTTDLTLQWSGRKKENGQIDPDYCRVLFYLDLEFLRETIVDLQIQQRVMKIAVINDTEAIRGFAAPFLQSLKTNLEEQGFKLSSVTFKGTEDEEKKNSVTQPSYYESSSYTGVDIRI